MNRGVFYAVLVLAASAGNIRAGGLVVAADGVSSYAIVRAAAEDEKKIFESAELLQTLIAEASGAVLPVFAESEAPPDVPAIYLGRSAAARRAGIDVDAVSGWGYLMRAVGPDIFLVGEDRPGDDNMRAFNGYSGTLKAVTAFLERYAGVRFVLPGPWGVHVPAIDRLVVEADLDRVWTPLFQFVIGRHVRIRPSGAQGGYDREREYDPYAVANNFFGRANQDTDVFYSYGGHSYPYAVPREKYFDSHPEYFALLNGKRNPTTRNHLCISNPEVHALMIKELEHRFDQGYQMVLLGQSDGYRQCECDDCRAIHPATGEKIWIIHRRLAEEMQQRRPGRQVALLSYVWTTAPPRTFDRFPDNVVIMNNRYVPEYFQAWAPYNLPQIVYLPNWLGTFRRIPPRYAVDQVRLFLENNVQGLYLCGGLDCGSGSGWGLNGPGYYAFGKAMEDPTRDAAEWEREFVNASYGAAAAPMRSFFSTMHRRWEFRALYDRREVGTPDRRYRGYAFEMKPSDGYCHFYPPKTLNDMRAALQRALDMDVDEKVRARLALVASEFDLLYSTAVVHHVYRVYRLDPTPASLRMLADAVGQYRQTVDRLMPNGRPMRPGALRAPYNGIRIEPAGGAPFGWDFEALRATGELPRADVEIRDRGSRAGLAPYKFRPHPASEDYVFDADEPDGFLDVERAAPYDM